MAEPTKLTVVWSSDNRDVAKNMVFMYTHNAKKQGWFDDVRLIVWGPSQTLLLGDPGLQAHIKRMQEDGVEVFACKACAENYDIVEPLAATGITVMYTGVMLSDALKNREFTITF